MQYINIYGKKRNIGKKYIESIRSSGKVPCILYGKNINIPFSTSLESFKNLIYTSKIHWVNIQIEGENNINAVQKEIQFDPISEKILHVDFCKIDQKKSIILEIPVKTFGRPIGVSKGGEYYSTIRKLKIKAIPSFFPEYIKLDISNLDIGEKITVKDIYPKEYTILHPTNTLIARVKHSRITTTSTEEKKTDPISNKKESQEENKKNNIKK
ncbi:50S ribosomal protein L25 [Blattabacterium punctulatus]|uniref:50S ribosomal protein L25 n=1 Tax=Blattabacterium punctulatus TaxID=164514 RepID=UPI000D7CB74B|nr:50S ribosomal protein L25 [Blattabacterium punctulatus]AWU44441.1 50S ribosomal protein L25 [Blattabacterium punctulatus]